MANAPVQLVKLKALAGRAEKAFYAASVPTTTLWFGGTAASRHKCCGRRFAGPTTCLRSPSSILGCRALAGFHARFARRFGEWRGRVCVAFRIGQQ